MKNILLSHETPYVLPPFVLYQIMALYSSQRQVFRPMQYRFYVNLRA